MPSGFFEKFPDARAVTSEGKVASDTEYGTNADIVSLYHEGYLKASRSYIKNLVSGLPYEKFLWFETTVEPQYTGSLRLDYGEAARKEYAIWKHENKITEAEIPDCPVPNIWCDTCKTWNKFRSQWLAKWVNEDALVFKSVAGDKAWIASDFLFTSDGEDQIHRDGDPDEFLANLTVPDIIQVNWHWNLSSNKANSDAYKHIQEAQAKNGRSDWVISEHMTLNGSDYVSFNIYNVLRNTIKNSTRFGWEFVNTCANSNDSFCVYYSDWKPKPPMETVEKNWDYWIGQIRAVEAQSKK